MPASKKAKKAAPKKQQPKKIVNKKPAHKKVEKHAAPLAQAAVQEVMEQVMLASPPPEVKEESDKEVREKAAAVKAAQDAEVKRLVKLGLVEVEVRGSPYKLVGLADPEAEPSLEQRVEMAKRMNAVGPLLPRYIMKVEKREPEKPTPGAEMPKKGSGIPGVTTAEIEKAHAANLKELESIEADRAKRAKENERKKKEREKLDAKMRSKKTVAPKVVVKDEPKKGGKTPAAEKPAPAKKGKAMKVLDVPKGGFNKSNAPATSGELIKARVMEHKLTDEQIADEVRKLFPGRNTKVSDVRWNRGQLRKHGIDAPDPVGEAPQPAKGKK